MPNADKSRQGKGGLKTTYFLYTSSKDDLISPYLFKILYEVRTIQKVRKTCS